MLKRIIPLILVLLILGAGVVYMLTTEREESGNMQALYLQTEPLQRQRDALVAQKEELAESFKQEIRDVSTVQILFRESNVQLFTHAYPLMRERGITGVIGMNLDDFPGNGVQTRISLEHYNRLIMDGWGSCLVYNGKPNLDTFLRSMKDVLDYRDIAYPTTIYFTEQSKTYDPETMDPLLKTYGINTVVVNATDGHSSTVSEVGDMWRTGAMPWNYTGINTDLELLAITDSGNLTLTASFTGIWDGMMKEKIVTNYSKPVEPEVLEAFVTFLDTIESMLDKESSLIAPTPTPTPTPANGVEAVELLLRTTDFVTARQSHQTAQATNDKHLAEYQQMQADLDAQIAELDKQINDIYTAFNIKTSSTKKSEAGEASATSESGETA